MFVSLITVFIENSDSTAETGTYTARHTLFKRYLTRDIIFLCDFGNIFEHGHRTAGTYNINVAQNGSYVWFNVPSSMTIHGATMSGFEFPLEAPTNVTINGVAYKSYRSSNTYNAGTLTIVIS